MHPSSPISSPAGLRKLRIGIDVGGTFTDVVAIDQQTHELVGQTKVPTSHDASEGVAAGILQALQLMIADLGIQPGEIVFLAHSTTQATNALLEGDVCRVGIIGSWKGFLGFLARREIALGSIRLAEGRFLHCDSFYIAANGTVSDEQIQEAVTRLRDGNISALVAAEPFSVDHGLLETRIVEKARAMGLAATATHEVSSLYGLRLRTRTSAINAAILPRMIQTSEMTLNSVRNSGIEAPLMIMRSDGGVMDISEMKRRPILSFLSGPAAGIAGALMYEKVSDGILLEVGGTSTDISVIRDGLPQTRPASIGGHRVFLNTLDVRTIGLAGGSMLRVADGRLSGVGPRSAHIAGCRYLAFSTAAEIEDATVKEVTTSADDSNRYLVLERRDGVRIAPTLTCAANAKGYVQDDQYSFGDRAAVEAGFVKIARHLSINPEKLADAIFDHALPMVEHQLEHLIREYRLERDMLELVGGGGGSAALLPALAARREWNCRVARNAPVISAIGVALAMVKEVVERSIANATDEDVLRVRREAESAAIRAGAQASTVEVRVEVDRQRNVVRATASGTTEIREGAGQKKGTDSLSDQELHQRAARSLQMETASLERVGATDTFVLFQGSETSSRAGGFWKTVREGLRVIDRQGVIRLRKKRGAVRPVTVGEVETALEFAVAEQSVFGDAGQILPDVYLLYGGRMANFTGIAQSEHVVRLALDELKGTPEEEEVILLVCQREREA